MFKFIDMIGQEVHLKRFPKRIVSLVPSQTELLFDLGLDNEVVGITKFCIHPEAWFRSKKRVGGTKNIAIEAIKSLSPDLIIANKEENVKEQIEQLASTAPVWVSDVSDLTSALSMINQIGEIVDKPKQAQILIDEINSGFQTLESNAQKLKVLYLIWQNPWMTVGSDTFIHDMICRMGWQNVAENQKRYPVFSEDEMIAAQPDIVLLSSEPFPFKEKHIQILKNILPTSKVLLVDGEMFSWYGSRLKMSSAYFKELLISIS